MNRRIFASLQGIAVGDAIGKQTENLSRADVLRWYPYGVRGFDGTPGAIIPRYAGNKRHQWRIGETTDDTERTIAVARAILHDRSIRHETVGREMLRCRKSVHPGVASLWEFHRADDATRTTDRHDGCGAAVRIAPVGMAYRSSHLDTIVHAAGEASIPTHGGPLALAAAAATAAAVSAAIDGASASETLELALHAAAKAEWARSGTHESAFANALRTMHDDLAHRPTCSPDEIAASYFPTTPLTIVPLALALGTILDRADEAILLAANIGGDSDSVASIAGAIAGARHPATISAEWYQIVEQVNEHDLAAIARELSELRG